MRAEESARPWSHTAAPREHPRQDRQTALANEQTPSDVPGRWQVIQVGAWTSWRGLRMCLSGLENQAERMAAPVVLKFKSRSRVASLLRCCLYWADAVRRIPPLSSRRRPMREPATTSRHLTAYNNGVQTLRSAVWCSAGPRISEPEPSDQACEEAS